MATATGQAMPREVYLVPDVNAWVAVRGGVMGFGSRPVMGLGLPLLDDILLAKIEPEAWRRTCAQFRLEDAVLAPGPVVEMAPSPAEWTSTGG